MSTITDYKIPSGRPGVSFLLRNRRTGDGPPVLFVHGATYASTVMFDYPVEGVSWMSWMADAGFDAWCIDLPGYGGADRPVEMSGDPAAAAPLVDTAEAAADVRRAVAFILKQRSVPRLDLVGYSWGTAISGQVAAEVPVQIRRLVLAGALWVMEGADSWASRAALGSYRTVDAQAIVRRWTAGLDERQLAAIAPRERLLGWADAAVASDPESSRSDPPRLRAPMGVVKDVQEYWMQGRPSYDPGRILCPTLVVVGAWDQETTPAQGWGVFQALTGTAERRYTVIGDGTHSLLLENQRHQLYEVVAGFLSAAASPSASQT